MAKRMSSIMMPFRRSRHAARWPTRSRARVGLARVHPGRPRSPAQCYRCHSYLERRMTDRLLCAAAAIFAAIVSLSAQPPGVHVDRILVNGNIWTGDPATPRAEALAVAGDTIAAVGSSAEIRALATADTVVFDAGGRLVVPGFQDSHLHFPGGSVDEVDLHGAATLAEFQKRLADFARTHPTLRWITGHGWDYAAFPNQTVDRKYIDAVISDRPVY